MRRTWALLYGYVTLINAFSIDATCSLSLAPQHKVRTKLFTGCTVYQPLVFAQPDFQEDRPRKLSHEDDIIERLGRVRLEVSYSIYAYVSRLAHFLPHVF